MSQLSDSTQNEVDHTYERHSNETPSEAVIAAVAEATDQSPLEIEPLAEVIDPMHWMRYSEPRIKKRLLRLSPSNIVKSK
jgi:hypothetical protein